VTSCSRYENGGVTDYPGGPTARQGPARCNRGHHNRTRPRWHSIDRLLGCLSGSDIVGRRDRVAVAQGCECHRARSGSRSSRGHHLRPLGLCPTRRPQPQRRWVVLQSGRSDDADGEPAHDRLNGPVSTLDARSRERGGGSRSPHRPLPSPRRTDHPLPHAWHHRGTARRCSGWPRRPAGTTHLQGGHRGRLAGRTCPSIPGEGGSKPLLQFAPIRLSVAALRPAGGHTRV
jgi:hypothetical protein